jgi:hypothetical protein
LLERRTAMTRLMAGGIGFIAVAIVVIAWMVWRGGPDDVRGDTRPPPPATATSGHLVIPTTIPPPPDPTDVPAPTASTAPPAPTASTPPAVTTAATVVPPPTASARPPVVPPVATTATAPAPTVVPPVVPPTTPSGGGADLTAQAQRALEKGNGPLATELARKATEKDPTDAEAWLMLGAAYDMTQSRGRARAAYRSCVQKAQGPRVGECRALLGE